jgi:hypothetical protein
MRHAAVYFSVARLGLFVHHRHLADVAGDAAAGGAWLRLRAVVYAGAGAALRHRRAGRSDERGPAQCHRTLSRRAGWAGGGWVHPARARTILRHLSQYDLLSAAPALAGERALWAALSHRSAAAAARRARLGRHHPHRARNSRPFRHCVDDDFGRGGVVLRRQCLQLANAGLCRRSRPRRSGLVLQHAAGGRCLRRFPCRCPARE